MKSAERTLEVAGSVHGTYFYPLRVLEVNPFRSLCGQQVMHTSINGRAWAPPPAMSSR